MKFDYVIKVLEEQKNRLESQQKCFANKSIFYSDIQEISAAIKILQRESND